MTLAEFDALQTGDRVSFWSELYKRHIGGTARREDAETVKLDWDDHQSMTVRRHEVRIYSYLFERFTVERTGSSSEDGTAGSEASG